MTSRFGLEVALLWSGLALYLVSLVAFAVTVVLGRELRRLAMVALVAGLVPHGAALVSRWVEVGHGPYMLKYEVLASNAWVAIAGLALALRKRAGRDALALVVVPVAILLVALGLSTEPRVRALPPTLRSAWLVFHITFAKVAAAALLLSVASAVVLLLKDRGRAPAWMARTPDVDALDAYQIRFVGLGFFFWTIAVAAGAIWANQSWGRYWGWDAIETWSLVTWVLYGSLLHLRLFFRLGPKPTAWGTLGAFAVFILTLLVLPFLMPSLHAAYFQ